MACYAALASLLELLHSIIHQNRYHKFLSSRKQVMESLHEKFNSLQELLQDYSFKGDEEADRMEMRIINSAHRAQDIIELEISNQIDWEGRNVFQKILHHLNFVSKKCFCSPEKEVKVDENLHKVEVEVDSILRGVMDIKESQTTEDFQLNNHSADTSASVGKNTMVGFDEHAIVIKDQLCGLSPQLVIIPIVGMGGAGKTTLASNVFHDALIVGHFDCRAWGTVSQNCTVNSVLERILQSLGLMKDGLLGEEERILKECIYKYLKGRRYLVVIDDIWRTADWDGLKQIFPDDCNGSRVVITTRLLDVAHYAETSSSMHMMRFLNEGESWNLFREKLFAGKECPPELVGIGKSIVNACGGLPLAIVVIAGVLSNTKTPHHWEIIARSTTSVLSGRDGNVSKILALSYDHLSHQLKSCFLYMGGFPEDHEINISELIRLWTAEGFLKRADQSISLEEVGEELVEDLVRRSLIIISKRRASGQFKFCKMHDLLRDFCREKAASEKFLLTVQVNRESYPRGVENGRRLSLSYPFWGSSSTVQTGGSVQSMHLFGSNQSAFKVTWGNFKLLKILNAPEASFWPMPNAIFQMFHLKYLALSPGSSEYRVYYRKPVRFPASVSMLQNLQTIIFHGHREITLPSEFWMMQQLRHVIIHNMILPSVSMVHGTALRKLEYLQTLETVLGCQITNEMIGMIPNMKKLKLRYRKDEVMGGTKVYCLNNVAHLAQLEELNIAYQCEFSRSGGFAFPQNLRKLSLKGCRLPWKDLTMVGSLPNLQVLRLRNDSFVGEEWEAIDGEFMRLTFLLLEELNLKYWRAETTHFPCLEQLKIRDCDELEEIPLEFGDIQTLTLIEVYGNELVRKSAKLILQEQESLENNSLRVHVHNEGCRWGESTIRRVVLRRKYTRGPHIIL